MNLKLVVGILLVCLMVGVVGAAEQITNGNFETGDMTGWAVFGSPAPSANTTQVHTGTYSAILPDYYYYSNISQNVDFTGVTNLTFWDFHYGTGMTIKVDNDIIYTFSVTDTEWAYKDIPVSYTGVHKLTFIGNQDNNFWIDDISALSSDATPPASITNLANNTATCTEINWTWTKPSDADFNYTYVLKDNVWNANVTNTTNFVKWTGLTGGQTYTFSSKTVDTTGYMNTTWVNQSATSGTCAGATTAIYPLNTINSTRILPASDTTLPATGLNISVNATPGQFEQFSFVAKPSTAVTDYAIAATTLTDADGTGHTAIPTSALDLKIVGVWYQMSSYCADNAPSYDQDDCITANPKPSFNITPELLLNNKSLIRTNYTAQTNEVWVTNDTFSGYVHIDNTSIGQWKSDYKLYDNATAGGFPQNFSSLINENNQIWGTIHVPAGQSAGNYTGKIWINSSATTSVAVNVSVRVLPFTLVNATMDYGLYYMPPYSSAADHNDIRWAYYRKLPAFTAELQDMKNHGVLYPTFPQLTDDADLETALTTWDSVGFPKDKIYLLGLPGYNNYVGAGTGDASNASVSAMVTNWVGHTSSHGYTTTYFHGMEEQGLALIGNQRQAWTAVHSAGGKVWADDTVNALSSVADILDVGINAYIQNTTTVGIFHAYNHKLYNYGNPQGGYEDPERYRSRYGLPMWANGYDGEMTYAYQALRGGTADALWNEYDAGSSPIKGAMLTYPKTDGAVGTIAWEGFRQGIDDTRYADTLSNITGNKTEATSVITTGVAAGQDMSQIRNTLIAHILTYGSSIAPTASFTKNTTGGLLPVTVAFTDSSTGTPTTWNWNFGDGNWTNGTTQNPSYTYSYAGTYQSYLIASNSVGNNQSANQTITITAPDTTAPASITGLSNGTVTNNSILWQWTNPTDLDFNQTIQYKNGVLYYNSSNTTTAIIWTGLTNNTAYTFSSHTIDLSGNMNATWVNATATTNKLATPAAPVTPSTPASGMTMITQALSILGLLLVVGGIAGVVYSLAGISGMVGRGGSSFSVNSFVLVSSIITILVGAILLVITYAILSPLATIAGI
jgi:PKD repeat protein